MGKVKGLVASPTVLCGGYLIGLNAAMYTDL